MRKISRLIRALPAAFGLLILLGLCLLLLVSVQRTVEASGQIRITHYQIVRPRVPGIVSEVLVEPGMTVKAGQVLCKLLDYDFERQQLALSQQLGEARAQELSLQLRESQLHREVHPLEQAKEQKALADIRLEQQAQVARARELEIALDRSQETLTRIRGLQTAGLVSEQVLKDAEYDKLQAEQRLAQSRIGERQTLARTDGVQDNLALLGAQQRITLFDLSAQRQELSILIGQLTAQLDQLKRIGEHYSLRAEIAGVVVGSSVNDLRGKKVQPGEELLSVIDTSAVDFVTYIPEEALVRIRAGQEAYVELSGLPKRQFDVFQGQVQKVAEAPQLQQVGDDILYPVEIRLRQPWVRWEGNRFFVRSGMRGQAKIAYRYDVPLLVAIYELLVGEEGASPRSQRPSTGGQQR